MSKSLDYPCSNSVQPLSRDSQNNPWWLLFPGDFLAHGLNLVEEADPPVTNATRLTGYFVGRWWYFIHTNTIMRREYFLGNLPVCSLTKILRITSFTMNQNRLHTVSFIHRLWGKFFRKVVPTTEMVHRSRRNLHLAIPWHPRSIQPGKQRRNHGFPCLELAENPWTRWKTMESPKESYWKAWPPYGRVTCRREKMCSSCTSLMMHTAFSSALTGLVGPVFFFAISIFFDAFGYCRK